MGCHGNFPGHVPRTPRTFWDYRTLRARDRSMGQSKSGRVEELDRSIFQRHADDTTKFVHFRRTVKLIWAY